MNQLKIDIQKAISALSGSGWSQRRIARELGVDRETVARYRRLAREAAPANPAIPPAGSAAAGAAHGLAVAPSNPAIVPTGSGAVPETHSAVSPIGSSATRTPIDAPNPAKPPAGSESAPDANPAIPPAGSKTGRLSQCEPFTALIETGLERGLSAQRIYQDLVSEQQFGGSYDSVKRFVRQLAQTHPLPFRRMETEPGQEAQVDFGQGAWVVENGKRRRPHVLRVVLSHSRKAKVSYCT